jgi:tetratricopeptide (TPR) repeat protein
VINNVLTGLLVLLIHTVVMAETSVECEQENDSLEWKTIKQACNQNLSSLIAQKNIEEIGQKYFLFSKIAYTQKKYDFAEELLFILKKDFPSFLLKFENKYHWFYLKGKIKLRTGQYKEAILNFQESLLIAESMNNESKMKFLSYSLNGLGLSYSKINQPEFVL